MTTLYFLAIPLVLLLVVGLVIWLARERRPDALDHSISTFSSEMGALPPPGVGPQQRDPVRPAGYPNVRDPSVPLDVLLAQDAQRQAGQS